MPIRATACFSLPTAAFLARGTPQSGAACAGYSHPRAGRHKREKDGRGFSGWTASGWIAEGGGTGGERSGRMTETSRTDDGDEEDG
jgi:hypothetical protein